MEPETVSLECEAQEPPKIPPFNGWTMPKENQPWLICSGNAGMIFILLLHIIQLWMQ
jgi:hypothetical protein